MTVHPTNTPKLRILIVEDHVASAQALARMLERKFGGNATCHIATTLADGLSLAGQTRMDITIVDLCLPDATLEEVISHIPNFTHPVIIITNLDDHNSEIEIKCYENCAQNFFTKDSLRREIYEHQGAELISAITKAHWRHRLPQDKRDREEDARV